MKRLVGILITVQAILTGLILYGLNSISNSIKMAAAHINTPLNTFTWGENLHTSIYIALGAIVLAGAYLIVARDDNGK